MQTLFWDKSVSREDPYNSAPPKKTPTKKSKTETHQSQLFGI